MRVLLIKTSSMGDIIHTLPALTDAGNAIPGVIFDWVVEDTFKEIPHWHPLVHRVIPVALRRWRKGILSRETRIEWQHLLKQLRHHHYDFVLDAQGLVKSALLVFFTKGKRVGLDFRSAREGLASFAYQHKCTVDFYQHAVFRMRSLFSQALHYALPEAAPDFGLDRQQFLNQSSEKYVVFLHGTTWETKQWPESYWMRLALLAGAAGYKIKIGGGNPEEVQRAERIAKHNEHVDAIPYLSIGGMAALLANASAVVAVDTGLGHLAAALDVPTVSLYGSTNPAYTGALGKSSVHLLTPFSCSPCLNRVCTYKKASVVTPACYATLPPEQVWASIQAVIR